MERRGVKGRVGYRGKGVSDDCRGGCRSKGIKDYICEGDAVMKKFRI